FNFCFFFFSSRRRHTRFSRDRSSDVCSSDLFMAEYIIRRNPKMGRANGSLTLQGYGERKAEFSALVKKVSMMNKHIVFVAHRERSEERRVGKERRSKGVH